MRRHWVLNNFVENPKQIMMEIASKLNKVVSIESLSPDATLAVIIAIRPDIINKTTKKQIINAEFLVQFLVKSHL